MLGELPSSSLARTLQINIISKIILFFIELIEFVTILNFLSNPLLLPLNPSISINLMICCPASTSSGIETANSSCRNFGALSLMSMTWTVMRQVADRAGLPRSTALHAAHQCSEHATPGPTLISSNKCSVGLDGKLPPPFLPYSFHLKSEDVQTDIYDYIMAAIAIFLKLAFM